MEKQKYFEIAKDIKAMLVKEKVVRPYIRIYSDKRSEKSNGYRTKFYGINNDSIPSAITLVEKKYGKYVTVEGINNPTFSLFGRGYTVPSLVIRPKVLVK